MRRHSSPSSGAGVVRPISLRAVRRRPRAGPRPRSGLTETLSSSASRTNTSWFGRSGSSSRSTSSTHCRHSRTRKPQVPFDNVASLLEHLQEPRPDEAAATVEASPPGPAFGPSAPSRARLPLRDPRSRRPSLRSASRARERAGSRDRGLRVRRAATANLVQTSGSGTSARSGAPRLLQLRPDAGALAVRSRSRWPARGEDFPLQLLPPQGTQHEWAGARAPTRPRVDSCVRQSAGRVSGITRSSRPSRPKRATSPPPPWIGATELGRNA